MMLRCLGFLVCLAAVASADIVHLKDGRKIEGKVTDLGDAIKLERAGGSMKIEKSEIEKIETRDYAPPAESKSAGPVRKSRPKRKVRLTRDLTSISDNYVMFMTSAWGGDSPVIRGPIPGPGQLSIVPGSKAFDGKIEDALVECKKEVGQAAAWEEVFSIVGRPAAQFEFTGDRTNGKVTSLVQLVKCDEKVLTWIFSAREEDFDKNWHDVNMMFRSVKWLKRVDLSEEKQEQVLDLYEKGYRALQAGRGEEALARYKEAAAILPDVAVLHSAMGAAYVNLKEYRNAVVAFQLALKKMPDNVNTFWLLASAYYAWGKTEDALRELTRVMETDPENDEAFYYTGLIHAQKEKWMEAKSIWKRGAGKNPDSTALHLMWGQAAERCEKWNEAREAYEKALKIEPGNAPAKQALDEMKKRRRL